MRMIKVTDAGTEYPYTIEQLRQDNPNTSFPTRLNADVLEQFNVYEVVLTSPPQYDYVSHKLSEGIPVRQKARNEDGTWKGDDPTTPENEAWEYVQVWQVKQCTAEELTENIAEYNAHQETLRIRAYRDEADPLFFKWQRGEATQQEWLDAVASVKAKYMDYNG